VPSAGRTSALIAVCKRGNAAKVLSVSFHRTSAMYLCTVCTKSFALGFKLLYTSAAQASKVASFKLLESTREGRYMLFSDHNESLLSRQPGALESMSEAIRQHIPSMSSTRKTDCEGLSLRSAKMPLKTRSPTKLGKVAPLTSSLCSISMSWQSLDRKYSLPPIASHTCNYM